MFYFIKPKTVLKFPKDKKITEFIKVKKEFSEKSDKQFIQVLKLWHDTHKTISKKRKEVKK